ncbi:MAG TPA: ATP-grasp domain-containing protein [Gaiellales bacterium]|nr:ATP-grasp domain-containing protein [Gaiellales bacterium]
MTVARGRVLVLDGDTRAGLEIARRLHRLGERVAIASSEAGASGMRTRAAEARVVLPDPRTAFDGYADGIADALASGDVAMCSGERALEALRARREAIAARGAIAAIASEPALTIAGSKQLTLDRAAALGIDCPRSLQVSNPEAVLEGAGELGYPLVVKPLASWRALPGGGGETVAPMLAYDRAGLEVVARRLVRADAPALLQQVATGVRETHKFLLQDGRVIARLVMVAERCWPPLGGSSVMRVTVEPPADSYELALALVTDVGLEGVSEVEFRRDAAGRPLLMEINARISQSIALAHRAGVELAQLHLRWARGEHLEPVADYRRGVRLGWPAGEARLLACGLIGRLDPRPRPLDELRDIARDYGLRHAGLEGLDRRDLAPTAAALTFTLRSAGGWLRRA